MFAGKTLLITGGTGTFGNAVLSRLIEAPLEEIRIFSRDEKKQDEMRNALKNPKVKEISANVTSFFHLLPTTSPPKKLQVFLGYSLPCLATNYNLIHP